MNPDYQKGDPYTCSDCGKKLDANDPETKGLGLGYVSPESTTKTNQTALGVVITMQQESVCKDCYEAALKRVYGKQEEKSTV